MRPSLIRRLAALLLLTTSVKAQVVPAEKTHLVLREPAQGKVAVHSGLVFAPDKNPPLAFDLFLPPDLPADARLPVVVLISGAESARTWPWFQELGRLIAAHGMAAVVPDKRYPRGWDGTLSGTADTEALLTFLQTHGAAHQLDASRFALWTFSAGGRMTAVGLRNTGLVPRCLVSFYGYLDLEDELASVADEARRNELLARYSPRHAFVALGAGAPPFFVARAGKDSLGINRTIDRLAADSLTRNLPLTLVNYPNGDHGFDGYNDTDESRRILRQALDFLREHLLGPTAQP